MNGMNATAVSSCRLAQVLPRRAAPAPVAAAGAADDRLPEPIAALAACLLDPGCPTPAALRSWNGSDPTGRLAVYRNNVVASLIAALGDTCPAGRRLAGATRFDRLAHAFIVQQPPSSPVLADHGAGFGNWLAQAVPPADLPSPALPDLARLEFARVQAWHAADAEPLPAAALAAALADPAGLPGARPVLHPSAAVIRSAWPVLSLWQHFDDPDAPPTAAPPLDTGPEQALVVRPGDEVAVLRLGAGEAAFCAAFIGGRTLADALGAALATEPGFALDQALARLIHHRCLVGWRAPADHAAS